MTDTRMIERLFNSLLESIRMKGCRGPKKWMEGIESELNGDVDRALELFIDGMEDEDFNSYLLATVECELSALNLSFNQRVLLLQRYVGRQQTWIREAA